jgi:hypothetical protein
MRTLSDVPTESSPKVVILPWLSIGEPKDFAGVRIFPREDAIHHARSVYDCDLSEHVERATSYFGSGERYPRSVDLLLKSLRDEDVLPELVQPSVIFLNDVTTIERVDKALAALNVACMAASNAKRNTNAVVFERYVQTLVLDPEYIVPMSRQMFGSKTTGTRAINLLVTRPHRCGEFQAPQPDHWDAFAQALDAPEGARAIEAARNLLFATQDIETLPEDLERSLYAIALERLLSLKNAERKALEDEIVDERVRNGVSKTKARNVSEFDVQLRRAQNLLQPLLGPQVPTIKFGYHIMRAWEAMRRERNGVWHAEVRAADKYDFEKQHAVRLNHIWFRVAQALIIGSLVEGGFARRDDRLALAVLAIESWIGFISEDDARDPAVANAMNNWWATAITCSGSFMQSRDSAEWRAYFDDAGRFVVPGGARIFHKDRSTR